MIGKLTPEVLRTSYKKPVSWQCNALGASVTYSWMKDYKVFRHITNVFNLVTSVVSYHGTMPLQFIGTNAPVVTFSEKVEEFIKVRCSEVRKPSKLQVYTFGPDEISLLSQLMIQLIFNSSIPHRKRNCFELSNIRVTGYSV